MLTLLENTWRDLWDHADQYESVGSVFTKTEIVELILDLAGYRVEATRLASCSVLEPSCGDGAFLTHLIARLLQSELHHRGAIDWEDPVMMDSLRAADISSRALSAAATMVTEQLEAAGCPTLRASELAHTWLVETDFLLSEWSGRFDFVIGNPPYVRIESLPKRVLERYRAIFRTVTDRADLYVAFFEQSLKLLSPSGVLAFICANRFAKNQYGQQVRALIAERHHVRYYINLEHTQPFESEVSAYPAIIVLDQSQGEPTWAGTLPDIAPIRIRKLREGALNPSERSLGLSCFDKWYERGEPWLTTERAEYQLLMKLRSGFVTLEESAPGTKVGIGVATGADKVYVLPGLHPEIEASRQVPLVLAKDIHNEEVVWSGHYVINPFKAEGGLVDLANYPGLASYLAVHSSRLKERHVARSREAAWYRTIDRIWLELQHKTKLLVPDIKGAATIGFDGGAYYPHHNVYWICSESWDLKALKTILRSSVVLRQVKGHSVAMRGGNLRFQAQTLRRIRIPELGTLSDNQVDLLASASQGSQAEVDLVVDGIYSGLGFRSSGNDRPTDSIVDAVAYTGSDTL